MESRTLADGIHWVGVIDWDRRTFDELVPLPEGTTYNAWLVRGTVRTALVDTVDPDFADVLLARLEELGVTALDYVIANHAEQDHSGSLPRVLERFPEARVVATPKGRNILVDLLGIREERFLTVEDGATLDLGGRTLRFLHFPWVHWPETMVTWLEEDRLLFSCDLFGAHQTGITEIACASPASLAAARRYYAEIMMPYRNVIRSNLPRVAALPLAAVCPSHGPVWREPRAIVDAYAGWVADVPGTRVAVAYVSMHASTRLMARHLADALVARGLEVEVLNLAAADLGRVAEALVDAGTLALGSPTVLGGAHPLVASAAYLANLLKPPLRIGAVFGSYGWGGKMVAQLAGLMPQLKLEMLDPVVAKGLPRADDFAALDRLADTIAARQAGEGAPAAAE
jgi:flavorubredoxin